MNGDVKALSRADQVTRKQYHQSKTENCHQGGKVEASAETGELNNNKEQGSDMWQAIQNITGYKSICKATLLDERKTFYAQLDLPNRVSCKVYSTSNNAQENLFIISL